MMQLFEEYFAQFTPDPLFLLAASGFLGVILAFLIPMNIDITSKVAAKYNSDVIVRTFQSNNITKYFPYFVLINICMMIIMRFFVSDDFYNTDIAKNVMWMLLVCSVIISGLIGYIIFRLERIISDDNVPLQMLMDNIESLLGSRNILIKESKKQGAIESIEGIGDIILYQIQRKNNRSAGYAVSRLTNMVVKLIRLNVFKPDKFAKLVYSRELIRYRQDNTPQAINQFCFKDTNKHLSLLASYINQLERVYLTAIDKNNDEVAKFTIRALNNCLHHASIQSNNELVVEFIVSKIHNCVRSSINADNSISRSIAAWYIDNLLQQPHRGKSSFHVPYLDIYDPYFIRIMKQIITAGKFNKFTSVIDYMADNFNFTEYQQEKLWGYHYLLRAANFEKYLTINREQRVQRRVRNLIEEESQMYTIAQLNDWLDSFAALKEIIESNLTAEEDKKKARLLEGEIKDNAIRHLKYTRMLRLSYVIGSLCMQNDNYEYIRYMRDVGRDLSKRTSSLNLIPQTLQQAMNDYLIFYDLYERHGISASAYRRYMLMLIEDLFDTEARQVFYLPFLRQEQIAPGMQALNGLIEIGDEGLQEKNSKKLETVIKFLKQEHKGIERLIVKMRSNLTIDKKVTDNFYKSFTEGFNSRIVIRNIFKQYLNSYENKSKSKFKKLPNRPWGINELVEKVNILSSNDKLKRTASQYGETMADIENMTIFNNLIKHCSRPRTAKLDNFLRRLNNPEDLIIISSYAGVSKLLKQQERFHMARYIDDARTTTQRDIDNLSKMKGFVGYYDVNDHPIPVFNFYYRGEGEYILVLHKSKLGKITQMPLVPHPTNKKKYLKITKDSMYFQLEELAKNPKSIKTYIDAAPPWLTEVGDIKQQKDFLKQRLLITALENILITPASKDGPIGYVINASKTISNNGQSLRREIV